MSDLLNNKVIVVTGIANKKSIAYGCYKKIIENGGTAIVTYQNDRMRRSLEKFMPEDQWMLQCDVSNEAEVKKVFDKIESKYTSIDGLIHSVAYSPKAVLTDKFSNTTLEDFDITMNISVYSLILLTKYAAKLMQNGGSIVALTFMGSIRAIPNYNAMGVAKSALESSVRYLAAELGSKKINVNSISAGAQKTLAVTGVKDSNELIKESRAHTVSNENVTNLEVGGLATYLLSDLSSGVTGDCIYADNGVHLL